MQRLRLKSIRLKDFLSHPESRIDFRDRQRLLLDGASGHGKSSVLDAVSWNLYGEGRSDNRSMVRKGAKEAVVELTLTDGESDWKVVRKATSGGKHELAAFTKPCAETDWECVPAVGVRGVQGWIEESLTGCSRLLFENSVMWPQERSESFVNLPPAKKKDALLEMAKSIDFDGYLKKARELSTAAERDKAVADNTMSYLYERVREDEAKAALIGQRKMDEASAKREVEQLDVLLTLRAEDKARLELAEQSFMSASRESASCEREFASLSSSLKSCYDRLDERRIVIAQCNLWISGSSHDVTVEQLDAMEAKSFEKTAWRSKWGEITRAKEFFEEAIGRSEEVINSQKDKIAAMRSEVIESCEAINAPCPKIKLKHDAMIAAYVSDLVKREGDQADRKKQLKAKIEEEVALLGQEPEFDEQAYRMAKVNLRLAMDTRSRLSSAEESAKEIETEIKEKSGLLNAAAARLSLAKGSLGVRKNELEAVRSSAGDILALQKRRDEAFTAYSSRIAETRQSAQAMDDMKDNGSKLAKSDAESKRLATDISDLESMKAALGQNGIRAMIVDVVAPRLEDKANDVLSRLSDFTLRIDTQKEGASGNSVEGLFLTVVDPQGNHMELSNYSGGEKMKIQISLSEALAEMQRLDFRLCDEAFIGLDEESVERFSESLMAIQDRYSQLVCVSHLPAIKALFDERITVTKRDGRSELSTTGKA